MRWRVRPVLPVMAAAALAITGASARSASRTRSAPPRPIVSGHRARVLSPALLQAAQRNATRGTVSADRKSLTFGGRSIRIVVTTGPENDMLSYRIRGLRNPTIILPAGARVRLLFVNTDEDMRHDLRFTAARPPFPARPNVAATEGSRRLAPSDKGRFHGEEMTVRVPARAGSFTYLCTVPGHAQGGMYGRITVR